MAQNNNQESPKQIGNLLNIFNTPAFKQFVFLVGLAFSVTAGLYVYNAIQEPLYRPLDYRMTDKNAAVIADTLDKAGIHYKINTRDGVVLVAASDLQSAKYKLAAAGVQRDDSFNFNYLNDQSSIGESQFIESARYLRALEGDLVKTIAAIDGVANARVHIAVPQSNVFADETGKPTASVFLTVGNGMLLDKEKIRSIVQIVASSVPGLDPKNVAITDQYGHFLSNSLTEDSIQSAEQMNYKNNIQQYYEKRIESLITPLIGANKVNVRVNADIDFTQQEEAKEQYDPNQKVVRSEETVTEETGSSSAGGAAGALANSPPTAGGQSGNKSSSTQGRNQSIKNYELSKSVTYKKSNIATVKHMSVAVIVDNDREIDPATGEEKIKPMTKERIEQIKDLVKATIGFDPNRGDVVTVVNSAFTLPKPDKPMAKTPFYMEGWFWDVLRKMASILFGLAVFGFLYKKLSGDFKNIKLSGAGGGHSVGGSSNELTPEMQKLKQEQINHLKEFASRDPNRVALVIKNWMSEK